VVRKLVGGKAERRGRTRAEAVPAGSPVLLGENVVFPAANGFVYRVQWGEPDLKNPQKSDPVSLLRGPRWRPEGRNPNSPCFLVPLGPDRLAVSDGDRTLTVWLWPAGGAEQLGGESWTLPNSIAVPPLLLVGSDTSSPRLVMADVTGMVSLFAADRGGEPIRRWRPDGKDMPTGKPTSGFAMQPGPFGGLSVAYVVDGRHVVTLDPDADKGQWGIRGEDKPERVIVGTPQPAGQGAWLVTDLGGRIVRLNQANGQWTVVGRVGLPGVVPVAAGVPVEPFGVIVPLSDGSAAIVDRTAPVNEP
jgi:hypothetical protein